MANTKSARRAVRVSERKRARRQPIVSELKTHVRKAERLVAEGSEEAAGAVRTAVIAFDKAAEKGIIHRNNAARRKSRLTKKLNALAGKSGE